MASYSFLDVSVVISGTGGSFDLGECSAAEGVTIAHDNPMTETTMGADGCIMHSLMEAGNLATVTVNLLKTSVTNSKLSTMLEAQKQSAATWGDNVISITDRARGDDITLSEAAFVTQPANGWAAVAGTIPWSFRGKVTSNKLGAGILANAIN